MKTHKLPTRKPRVKMVVLEFIAIEHPMLKGMKHPIQVPAVRITSSGHFYTVSIQ